MDSLVSVIVPIYNLELYVADCLYSLINQTYSNIEIICVDDGSTDNSQNIVKEIMRQDDRIVYIYKENGGVSSARNLGVKKANGEYIMFVDADDFLHRQAIELFVNSAVKDDVEVCSSLFCDTLSRNAVFNDIIDYRCEVVSEEDIFKANLQLSSCAKLFKKDFVDKVSFFEDLSNCEDFAYFISILSLKPKLSIIYEELYYYYQRPNSSSRNELSEKKINALKYISIISDKLKSDELVFLLAECIKKLFALLFSFKTMSIGTKFEAVINEFQKKYVKKWIPELWSNSYIDKKTKILFSAFFFLHSLYEIARMIQDPTMKDFYKNRRKNRKINGKG